MIIIITGAWGGGSAKLHNWCLGLRGRSPITTNGDAGDGDDQDDLGGGDDQEGHGEQSEGVVHILISPVATNGDAGDGDDQDGQDDHGGGGGVHCNGDHGAEDIDEHSDEHHYH